MSNFDDKLNILKKKKLTAKIIVEQQRNEIRLLKCKLSLNERLEEIYKRFDNKKNLDQVIWAKLMRISNDSNQTITLNDQIHQAIEDLSKLIEQIQIKLSINDKINLKHQDFDIILNKQKECMKLIKWKLSDIYAHRVADEVSCITS
jgi:hypothetical protein